jgi:hypothetical protein
MYGEPFLISFTDGILLKKGISTSHLRLSFLGGRFGLIISSHSLGNANNAP